MTFYQELQLSSAGSKQLIKNTTDKKEKWRHILIYNFKVYLVMAFCVAVVTLYTKLTLSKYQDFLANETRYSRLARAFPDRAKALFEKNQAAADARYEHLTKLVDLYK